MKRSEIKRLYAKISEFLTWGTSRSRGKTLEHQWVVRGEFESPVVKPTGKVVMVVEATTSSARQRPRKRGRRAGRRKEVRRAARAERVRQSREIADRLARSARVAQETANRLEEERRRTVASRNRVLVSENPGYRVCERCGKLRRRHCAYCFNGGYSCVCVDLRTRSEQEEVFPARRGRGAPRRTGRGRGRRGA